MIIDGGFWMRDGKGRDEKLKSEKQAVGSRQFSGKCRRSRVASVEDGVKNAELVGDIDRVSLPGENAMFEQGEGFIKFPVEPHRSENEKGFLTEFLEKAELKRFHCACIAKRMTTVNRSKFNEREAEEIAQTARAPGRVRASPFRNRNDQGPY